MFNGAEEKIRYLAQADATMNALFFAGVPRWFAIQLRQGYIQKGTCVTVERISTVYENAQDGLLCIEQPRFTFRVMDQDQTTARQALNALNRFLLGICLMTNQQFTSPPSTPSQFPNYKLSERLTIETQLELQIYVWSADWRIFNNLLVT